MDKTFTRADIENILKTVYLETANADLHITESTSKTDVQSLTASLFRQKMSEKINE